MDLVSDSDDGDEFEWDNDGNGDAGSSDGDEFGWDSEGDGGAASLNTACSSVQASRNLHAPGLSTLARLDSNGERDNGAASSVYTLDYFVRMGFSREIVLKAMTENGDRGEDSLLDLLLTYKEIGCNHSVDLHSSGCVPLPVDNDNDVLENSDEANNINGPSTLARLDSNGERDNEVALSMYTLEYFVRIGFSRETVLKALIENGDRGEDSLLDLLLTYHHVDDDDDVLENWVDANNNNDHLSSDDSGYEGFLQELSQRDKKVESLVSMGFCEDEAKMAITRCGQDADISLLVESISYQRDANKKEAGFDCCGSSVRRKRTKFMEKKKINGKRFGGGARESRGSIDGRHEESMPLPNPMVGFNLPGDRVSMDRLLPKEAIGRPFFYYENVALAPKGVWATISSFLYDIKPEFVDSKFFCAATRKRGYIHNLPTVNRSPLVPLPPKTILDAFPCTKQWWPSWDTREQFNCIQTCTAPSTLTERIRDALGNSEDPPCPEVQKYVLEQCRKWNLVWVGQHRVAPLEPHEIELLLGYPQDHTRGISRTERFRSLGNSFQINTVAYHLSVLKEMFPNGINVLSLFSGIGGAEIALHKLGIYMKTVVSVEISKVNRTVLRAWWNQTQSGTLIEITDVKDITEDWLESTMIRIGGFDLVIGGSPCNNFTGSNRHHRNGLAGEHSFLFYHFPRILGCVKSLMKRMQS